jgi:hypothetical protein
MAKSPVVVEDPAVVAFRAQIAAQREQTRQLAIGLPDVVALARAIAIKSALWGQREGVGAVTPAKRNAEVIKLETAFQKFYDNGDKVGSNAWWGLKVYIEALYGETINMPWIEVSSSKIKVDNGIAITLKTNTSDHKYPLDTVIFVTNGPKLNGMLEDGSTPRIGAAFVEDRKGFSVPDEPAILSALAMLYATSPFKFDELKGM